ncbi:hypothetical protein J2W35_003318 [Variovorax boronicumulans]|uniref:class I SAM-dependent methyltransferase n=1 Tax=Variovorax boronicumulans TaxID=436515 RepID=UPI00278B3BE3|nr:class I SAM-dependent methyltransferase [Variovorax boronicumulans]MDQ0082959.1 hypothetical protein [Variovorax boronicumulans]
MSMLKSLVLQIAPLRRLYEHRDHLAAQLDTESRAHKDLQRRIDEGDFRNPFHHFTANFDAIGTMRRYAAPDPQPTPGLVTNWLGVKIDPKVYPPVLEGLAGTVEPMPNPNNWHADVAEWAAALQSVDNANPDSFTMIELGCGWGCWMNNTGVAARSTGRRVHVIGVEGDKGHLDFARECLIMNGFAFEEVTLAHGIAASRGGVALFPRQGAAGGTWALAPIFGATHEQLAEAAAAGTHDELRMIPLAELVGDHPRIDLLHIDIQGGEADLIDDCIDLLNDKVAYMLVGTHSKQIEGRLYATLLKAGWRLEMERAAIFDVKERIEPFIMVDGVQGWRNPRHVRIDA